MLKMIDMVNLHILFAQEEVSANNFDPVFLKKSTNLYASFPNVPIPYLPGKEDICIITPALLFMHYSSLKNIIIYIR